MGPLALFDKSFLQSLNANEAALFDVLFRTNIAPIFYIETLADLSKENSRRSPEDEVGIIASKTPTWGSTVNASHISMCRGELMGHDVKMAQLPAVAGGRPVEVDGKKGIYYKPSREQLAFSRWQDGEFRKVERIMAREYRELVLKAPRVEPLPNPMRFRDLLAVRSFTEALVQNPASNWKVFNAGVETAAFTQEEMWQAIDIWCRKGLPPITQHAPYVAHLAEVDLFFSAAVASGHISAERASNKVDSAYLYYLPFTQVFISGDNLHARMTPHFLKGRQKFIWGPDLKQDLTRLVDVFRQHPEIDKQGLIKIASTPPPEDNGLISLLYDQYLPAWRKGFYEVKSDTVNNNPKAHAEIMRQIEEMKEQARKPQKRSIAVKNYTHEELDILTIERRVHIRRGDLQFLPSDVKTTKD